MEEEIIEETTAEQEVIEENPLAELEEKIKEQENRHLRLQADFDNFRRRTRTDRDAYEKYRAQDLVTDLLPVLDNFERALKVETNDENTKSFLQGMDMIYRSLLVALEKEGVEVIASVGEQFDPYIHQAVMQVSEEGYESNIIIDEFQKGYKLKDRVIRPSMVKVNE